MLIPEYFKAAARLLYERVFMPRTGSRELSGGKLTYTHPGGNEHVCLIVRAYGFICLREYGGRALSEHSAALQDDLRYHHEQRCRNAFPGYIRHDQAEVIIINEEEIIEVTANLSGRIHAGKNVKFLPARKRREYMGHHGELDPCCKIQLGAYTLLFGSDLCKIILYGL